MATIDLNCDMGESWYDRQLGDDRAILPHVSSCNLACGFHGGDALSLERTIGWALEAGVSIGAHPSYPDRKNFGRQFMRLPIGSLRALLRYQVGALRSLVERQGGRLRHLKPHGALYHAANADAEIAKSVVETGLEFKIAVVFGPPAGELRRAAAAAGLIFAPEGFIDRAYEADLRLRSRQLPGAILTGTAALGQALSLARDRQVTDAEGQVRELNVETLCLHGDHPGSAALARQVREALASEGIRVRAI